MQLHLVHWNKSKYENPGEAVKHGDGLAVVGILIESGNEDHEEFQKIIRALPEIRCKGAKTTFPDAVDPVRLLPNSRNYWTYDGSLTTPPLLECVTWILLKEPIQLSKDQVKRRSID